MSGAQLNLYAALRMQDGSVALGEKLAQFVTGDAGDFDFGAYPDGIYRIDFKAKPATGDLPPTIRTLRSRALYSEGSIAVHLRKGGKVEGRKIMVSFSNCGAHADF